MMNSSLSKDMDSDTDLIQAKYLDTSKSLTRRLLSDGSWAFIGRFLTVLLSTTINILLARLLTPEDMGAYFLAFSVMSGVATFGSLGLNQTVVRVVAEAVAQNKPGLAKYAIGKIFRYAILGGLVGAFLLQFLLGPWLATTIFHSEALLSVIIIVSPWVIVTVIQRILAESFRGFHDIRFTVLFGGIIASAISIGILGLLYFTQRKVDLSQAIIISLASATVSLIIGWFFLQTKLRGLDIINKGLSDRALLIIAWPLLITNLTFFLLNQTDLWLLGAYRTVEDVAAYGAALRLVTLVAIPLLIINAIVPPFIAELYSTGRTPELERILRDTATLAGVPAFIVLLIFILFSSHILGIVYGDFYRYGEGPIILVILSFGQLVNVFAGSCGNTLIMTGNQRTMMFVTVFSGLFTLVLGLFLVRSNGATGVAIASSMGLVIQNFSMWAGAKRKTGLWTHIDFMAINRFSKRYLQQYLVYTKKGY